LNISLHWYFIVLTRCAASQLHKTYGLQLSSNKNKEIKWILFGGKQFCPQFSFHIIFAHSSSVSVGETNFVVTVTAIHWVYKTLDAWLNLVWHMFSLRKLARLLRTTAVRESESKNMSGNVIDRV
jgi:hypothetical protein